MVEENLGKPSGGVSFNELFGEPVKGDVKIELAPLGDLEATIKEQVDAVLAGLTDRERFVLTRRFGISPDARGGLTLVETGRALAESVRRPRPYSERHIRRIEAGALFKLRGGLPAKSLHDYLEE